MNSRKSGCRVVLNGGRLCLAILFTLTVWFQQANAQQYNSDSWISKEHGTVTIIPTFGMRNSMIMNTYSLFQKWEFTIAGYFYNNDKDPLTDDGYSTSFYAKYMFYENKTKTGGAAVKAGTGMFPGYFDGDERTKDAFKTYWMNAPVTIPLFNDKVSWDIMPGATMTVNYGNTQTTAFGFSYSTRVAWYVFGPELGIVSEIFGAAGQAYSKPEIKAGLRWEPNPYSTFALTWGQELNGTNGAGLEFGVMLFTPPFACLGGCGNNK